jgi:hypothetical protein
MSAQFAPHTFKVVVEGIADFFLHPHFRAFIETDSNSPTLLLTTNDVTETGQGRLSQRHRREQAR